MEPVKWKRKEPGMKCNVVDQTQMMDSLEDTKRHAIPGILLAEFQTNKTDNELSLANTGGVCCI